MSYEDDRNTPYDDFEDSAQQAKDTAFDALDNALDYAKGAHDESNSAQQAAKAQQDASKAHQQSANNASSNLNRASQPKDAAEANQAAANQAHAASAGNAENAIVATDSAGKVQAGAEAAQAGAEAAQAGAEAAQAGAEAAKTGAEAGASAGTEAAAGAATAGVTLIVEAALKLGMGAGKGAAQLTTGDTSSDSIWTAFGGTAVGLVLLIFLAISGLFCYFTSFYNSFVSSSQNANNEEVQYSNVEDKNNGDDRTYFYSDGKKVDTLAQEEDYSYPYEPSAQKYKEETEECIKMAFTTQLLKITKILGYFDNKSNLFLKLIERYKDSNMDMNECEYNNTEWTSDELDDSKGVNMSLTYLWSQPFPYTKWISKQHGNQSYGKDVYYTVGDYLYTIGYSDSSTSAYFNKKIEEGIWDSDHPNLKVKKIPEDVMYNDVNFAEFTVIMSQGAFYQTRGGKYQSYLQLFDSDENQSLMFELTVKNLCPKFYGWEHEYEYDEEGNVIAEYRTIYHECWGDPHGGDMDLTDEKDRHLMYKLDIYPYGLRELYYIAGVDNGLAVDGLQPGSSSSINYPGIANYKLLDFSERTDRIYCRMDDIDGFLGTSHLSRRSELSNALCQGNTTSLDHEYIPITIDGGLPTTGRNPNRYVPLAELLNADDITKLMNAQDWAEYGNNGDLVYDGDLLDGMPDGIAKNILEYALSRCGKIRYTWGGTSDATGYDCSGLVMSAFKAYGVSLPRTANSQYGATARVSEGNLKPGDLVFRVKGSGTAEHVGIYVGNGQVVHASTSKASLDKQIKVSSLSQWQSYAASKGMTTQYGRVANVGGDKG